MYSQSLTWMFTCRLISRFLFVSCCCYWCCCCFVSVLVSYAEKTLLSLCWARRVCWGITHRSWTNNVPTVIPGLFTAYALSTLTLPLISLCFLSRVSLAILFVLVFSQDLSSTLVVGLDTAWKESRNRTQMTMISSHKALQISRGRM